MIPRRKGTFVRNLRSWYAESAFTCSEFTAAAVGMFSLGIYANVDSLSRDMYVTDVAVTIGAPGSNTGAEIGFEYGINGTFCNNAFWLRAGAGLAPVQTYISTRAALPPTIYNFFTNIGGTAIAISGDPLFIIPRGYVLWIAPGAANFLVESTIWGVMV